VRWQSRFIGSDTALDVFFDGWIQSAVAPDASGLCRRTPEFSRPLHGLLAETDLVPSGKALGCFHLGRFADARKLLLKYRLTNL